MPTCEKCGTGYNEGDVICVWCGNILTKSDTDTHKIKTTREKQKDLKKLLSEIVKAHENNEIGEEEFKKKKSEIAKKISEIKAQRTISKYKESYAEPETYKTPPRGGARKQKPSKWWYLTPLFFNIFGGIIAYFAIRKQNYKMARNMIDLGGFMLLLIIVSVAVIPTIMLNFQSPQNQQNTTMESNMTTGIENTTVESNMTTGIENTTTPQILEKIFINNSLEEACEILGLFSNYTDMQKQDVFTSTYKDKYITWEGTKLEAANKDAEGYILQLEHSIGCKVIARINLGQRAKLLEIGKDDEITFTAKISDYDTAGILHATDGEIVV